MAYNEKYKVTFCICTLYTIHNSLKTCQPLSRSRSSLSLSKSFSTQLFLFYFIYYYYFVLLLNSRTRTKNARRRIENGRENPSVMSAVGFETFRSCVERSNHCSAEARPIPAVLVVLVAPKCSVELACMRHSRTTIDVSPQPPPHGPPRTLRRPTPPHGPPRTLRRPSPISTTRRTLRRPTEHIWG